MSKGLNWLKARQSERGSFGDEITHVYNEAIAALALVEAYAATRDEAWMEPAQKAVDFLQGAQRIHPSGEGRWGWRYVPQQDLEQAGRRADGTFDDETKAQLSDADTSATGWVVAVLTNARSAGLTVSDDALDGAIAFLDSVSTTGGWVGYLSHEQAGVPVAGDHDEFDYHVGTMSALGIMMRLSTDFDPGQPFFAAAAEVIAKDLPRITNDKLSVDYYYWYHGSQALNLLQAHPASKKGKKKYAEAWNTALLESACQIQDRAKNRCGAGGWIVADRWSHYGGPVYSTAICVLALEACVRRKYIVAGKPVSIADGAQIPTRLRVRRHRGSRRAPRSAGSPSHRKTTHSEMPSMALLPLLALAASAFQTGTLPDGDHARLDRGAAGLAARRSSRGRGSAGAAADAPGHEQRLIPSVASRACPGRAGSRGGSLRCAP